MIVIPFFVSETEYSIYVGFDDEGIKRLQAYDPGELALQKLSKPWTDMQLRDVLIGYCTAADMEECMQVMRREGDVKVILRHLSRGWRYRPELGDNDGPPSSLRFSWKK